MLNIFRFGKILGRLTFPLQSVVFFVRVLFLSFPKKSVVITRHPSIAWLVQKKGARAVYECHDWFGRGKALALWFARTADLVVTTNGFIKEEFVKSGFREERVVVAPNGVNLDTYQLDIPKNEAIEKLDIPADIQEKMKKSFVALYTGSFTTMGVDKGISDILSALEELNEGVFFIAVGGSEKNIAHYKKEAQQKNVSPQTHFIGRVGQDTLAHFQRAADVLLMPFPQKAHYEYFMSPLKTFEYMASGQPIIASTLPSIREILDEKMAFFVPPESPHELARQIAFVQKNPEESKKRAEEAREAVQEYTWEKRARKITENLNTI